MKALNNSSVGVERSVDLNIMIGKKQVRHIFIVADISDTAILGMDFLRKYTCTWNWESNSMIVAGGYVPNNFNTQGKSSKVVACETMVIPARSETMMMGVVNKGQKTCSTGIISGCQQCMFEREVAVASALVQRQDNLVPLRILNPNVSSVTIFKGETVAVIIPVKQIEDFESS